MKKKNRKKGLIVLLVLMGCIALGYWLISNIQVDTEIEFIEVGSEDKNVGAKATLFDWNITNLGRQTGEVNTNIVGEYHIEYDLAFSPKRYEKTIYVVDTQIPEITLKGENEVTVKDWNEFAEPGFTATDNYDGDITNSVTTTISKKQDNCYEVIYSVTDSSGNKAEIKRTVYIVSGTVYLTFDDGPSFEITPKILDVLKEKNVPATFFVVGYDVKKQELIQREYEEGHTIGLHGFSHDYSKIYTDVDTLLENFYKIESLVEETTNGYTSKIIRFPGGSSNTVSKKYCTGIMTMAVERAKEEGYTYFDWNVDSSDAGGTRNSEEVYQNVISGIKPGRNNVILMHDSTGKTQTLEALGRIIDYCIENNYEFKAITMNTPPVQHNVSN